ncbi:MAG: prepilin peptidase [Deltaproteobacteria bacterium]|nr:prepilin peptidase [Deltaproteobacteria bacterium]
MFDLWIVSIIFILGMCIGSFLNVCIYRLPVSKSIVDPPRSICPDCNSHIPFYDNIPVLSYLWLKGRCRYCNTPISFRYPLVEFISGIAAVNVLFTSGVTLEGLIYFVFIASLVVITFIDIDHKIIPDIITLPGIPIGLVASFALPAVTTHKDGMGGGDIKLLGMIGTIIGWKGVIFTIFASSMVGTCVGMIMILVKGKNMKFAIPFGPFLSIGAISYIFFGEKILHWYFNSL